MSNREIIVFSVNEIITTCDHLLLFLFLLTFFLAGPLQIRDPNTANLYHRLVQCAVTCS